MQEPRTSVAAEQALLSAIIQATIRPSEAGLTPGDFEYPEHQEIFRAALDLEKQKQAIDLVTIVDKAGHDDLAISICTNGMGWSADLAMQHAQIVRENALRREAGRILVETSRMLSQPDQAVSSVCLSACDQLKNIIAGSSTIKTRSMKEIVFEKLEQIANPEAEEECLTTGLDKLDGFLNGGMTPSNFVVVGARPGAGKSAMLLSMAIAVASAGKRVLYISLEMGDGENALRTLTHVSGIAAQRFMQREDFCDKDLRRISDGITAYHLENIEHYAAAVCRVSDIRNLAVRMKDQGDLAMVCVDYIGLLRPEKSLGSRVNEISQITRDLKALAMELNIVVVAAAQLNRDNAKSDRRPVLSDLRESGSIEQDANIVIFVHDEGSPPDAFGSKRKEIILAKNRQGQLGIIRAVFRGGVTRFSEVG